MIFPNPPSPCSILTWGRTSSFPSSSLLSHSTFLLLNDDPRVHDTSFFSPSSGILVSAITFEWIILIRRSKKGFQIKWRRSFSARSLLPHNAFNESFLSDIKDQNDDDILQWSVTKNCPPANSPSFHVLMEIKQRINKMCYLAKFRSDATSEEKACLKGLSVRISETDGVEDLSIHPHSQLHNIPINQSEMKKVCFP